MDAACHPERVVKQEPGLFSDIAHGVLDVVGMIPVVGEVADGANALFYAAEGNKTDAALSAAAMIPIAGWAATGAKAVRKGMKIAGKAKAIKKVTGKVNRAATAVKAAAKRAKTQTTKTFDIVNYRPSSSPLENHHGVLDIWASKNIPNYVSRATNNPTIALTKAQHDATKRIYRDWLFEQTGKRVGGQVDWTRVAPREAQKLTERMFDAADVPQAAKAAYYQAFNRYIYR